MSELHPVCGVLFNHQPIDSGYKRAELSTFPTNLLMLTNRSGTALCLYSHGKVFVFHQAVTENTSLRIRLRQQRSDVHHRSLDETGLALVFKGECHDEHPKLRYT